MTKIKVGLQLFTVRDATAADFAGTLRKVAAMGYEGVEFAGYGGMAPEELAGLLQELNLKAIGSHVSLQAMEEQIDVEIAYLKAIGAKYAIVPWLPEELRTIEAWEPLVANLKRYAKTFKEAGLLFAYHNHDFELDLYIGEDRQLDALFKIFSTEDLKAELDMGWVQFAGIDPLAYIAKHAERLPLVHLKDYVKDSDKPYIDTVELGRGDLPLLSIIGAAEQAGAEWVIVEQDNCERDPLQAVEESINWLKQHYIEA